MSKTLWKQLTGAALAGGMYLAAVPAMADVKTGVDAWSAGDYATAVREWSEPAAQGDPDAQFNLAQAYRLGRGVEADPRQAEALYKLAAEQGHVKAADNYGLMLFQSDRREEAMPYVAAAADRGDPRAQYLVGIAHFNGDLVAKDWVRAYALMTLSNSTGLPQARSAIAQMDSYIPIEQREEAQVLARAIKAESDANRARELAAVDLALGAPQQAMPVTSSPAPMPAPVATASTSAASAGADFARPAQVAAAQPAAVPVSRPAPAPAPRPAAMNGPWKIQLGAFGEAGNADRLWARLSGKSELSGAQKIKQPAGRLTRLLAGGFASRGAAQTACNALKRGGQDCLVTR